VNLASAEFGEQNLPGVYGTDYIYPEPYGSASYFVSKGMNVFRIPFRWERLQNSVGTALNANELMRLKSAVAHLTNTLNASVILDPHNYARYYGKSIGSADSGAPTATDFVDFWSALANEFKGNAKVIFGLMNEPYSFDSETWAQIAQQAINAIRSTGAQQLILVPGTRWTGAHSWFTSGGDSGKSNADALISIQDSNFAFEFHQYFDYDFSGTNSICRSPSNDVLIRVQAVTNWLKTNNKRGFLGEFGVGDNALCSEAANLVLSHLDGNSDVWLGWTWWPAGPWWGNYFMSIEPKSGIDAPQMANILLLHVCNSQYTPPPTSAPMSNSVSVNCADTIPPSVPFYIELSYTTSDGTFGKTLVVDILDASYAWYGKGFVDIGTSFSGTLNLPVFPQNVALSVPYTLKAWIVGTDVYNTDPANAWRQEIVSNSSKIIKFSSTSTTAPPTFAPSKVPTLAPTTRLPTTKPPKSGGGGGGKGKP
jgi:endoglucanase